MEPSTDAPQLLKVEQVATRLGYTPEHTRRLLRDGILPSTKLGREWRVSAPALAAWLEQRSNPGTSTAKTS